VPVTQTSSGSGLTARDTNGNTLNGRKIEVGTFAGPASYTAGGFDVDLSARFTTLDRVLLILQVVGALGPRVFRVVLNTPDAGKFRVQSFRARFNQASLGDTSAQNPPAGVTLAGASGELTATEAAHLHGWGTLTSDGPSASVNPTAGVGGTVASNTHQHTAGTGNTGVGDAHAHATDVLYEHGHVVTQAEADTVATEDAATTDLSGFTWGYIAIGA